jgi:hypothetical protein
MSSHIKDVHCIVCKRENVSLTVCLECVEYCCDAHIYRHPNCSEGK